MPTSPTYAVYPNQLATTPGKFHVRCVKTYQNDAYEEQLAARNCLVFTDQDDARPALGRLELQAAMMRDRLARQRP